MSDQTEVNQTNGSGTGRKIKPGQLIAIAVLVVGGAIYGIPKIQYSRSHASTDNAYLAADIAQIAPEVTGKVSQVLVSHNQMVKAGDLLVVLDDSKYKIAVQQAKANLEAAIADARAAGINVDLTKSTTASQVTQAEGALAQSEGGVGSARADFDRSRAALAAAIASEAKAKADVVSTTSDIEIAQLGVDRAIQALASADAQLKSARASLSSSQASVATASARFKQAQRDTDRIRSLAESGAVSKQQLENSELALETARTQLDGLKEQVESARSLIAQRESEKASAEKQVQISKTILGQARTKLGAVKDLAKTAEAQTQAGKAQTRSALEVIRQSRGKVKQSEGVVAQAKTAGLQVSAREAGQKLAMAKVEQARAALQAAELDLQRTRIYAPISGRIGKKSVVVGNLVQVGSPILAIVSETGCWVAANFKETQIASLKQGLTVEIEVDGIPGRTYRGKVDSLSQATGATFALLPPDNATGNFVKVVQRVPVKIVFDPGQPGLEELKAGLSANVAVKIH